MKRSRSGDRSAWSEALDVDLAGHATLKQPVEHFHKKTPAQIEHEIQKSYIDWIEIMKQRVPELGLVYAIPNGGHRHPAVGAKMKREGVRRGVPDLHLPVARGRFLSLYLETKAPDGRLSSYQVARIRALRAAGNVVVVCHSTQQLITKTTEYLDGKIMDEQGNTTADR